MGDYCPIRCIHMLKIPPIWLKQNQTTGRHNLQGKTIQNTRKIDIQKVLSL